MLQKHLNLQTNLNFTHATLFLLCPFILWGTDLWSSELATRVAKKHHLLPFSFVWVLIHSKG